MPWYERKVQSGRLLEVERYYATRVNGKPNVRGELTGEGTPEDVERTNQRDAQRKLMRLINCNFSHEAGDLILTLTHKNRVTEDEAVRAERNMIGRIKRLREKRGLEPLKYIAVLENQGRWHSHIIVNAGISIEELTKLWGKGRVTGSVLEDTYTYAELARYLTKQIKKRKNEKSGENTKQARQKNAHRWHASKGLKQPVVTKREIKREVKFAEPKAPKGYELIRENVILTADMFGNLYLYFACRRVSGFTVVSNGSGRKPGGARGRAPAAGT